MCLYNRTQADRGPLPCKSPFEKSHTSLKKSQALGKPQAPGLSRHSPEQLYQPLLQVLLGSVQVIQVSEHLLVILLLVRRLLAESVVIFLGLCGGSFEFLLGPGGGVLSCPDHPLFPAPPFPLG